MIEPQYVYHFKYPPQTVDVRNMTIIQLEWVDGVINHGVDPDIVLLKEEYDRVIMMIKDHFPEKLI